MADASAPAVAPGRPQEIEEPTNLFLVHPVSRAIVDRLAATPVTPNQISVASVVMAVCAAASYLMLPWPWAAGAGLLFQFAWHVLDGADGDLARRTGRASPIGELVDGVCDHLSQAAIYVALAILLQRRIGGAAWGLAALAAISHFVQANAYESGRKTYRRWVYGASWMRQSLGDIARKGTLQGVLSGVYIRLSNLTDPGDRVVGEAMSPAIAAGGPAAAAAREAYRQAFVPVVRGSFWLGGNCRTAAVLASMLLGNPLWFFLFEIVALNVVLAVVWRVRLRTSQRLAASLQAANFAAT